VQRVRECECRVQTAVAVRRWECRGVEWQSGSAVQQYTVVIRSNSIADRSTVSLGWVLR